MPPMNTKRSKEKNGQNLTEKQPPKKTASKKLSSAEKKKEG